MKNNTLKITLLALLLTPLFLASCSKKKSTAPASTFIINGIHDIDMAGAGTGGNILTVSIVQSSGTQQPVTLSVTGLPTGITADIQPARGTPDFGAQITFIQAVSVTGGTYPIHIIGTSSAYTKTYDLNLTVPAFNGFMLDGNTYNASSLQHSSNSVGGGLYASQILIYSGDHGGGYLSANISEPWPVTNGSYTYHIGGFATDAMNIYFQDSGSTFYSSDFISDTTKQATVTITNGKFSLHITSAMLGSSFSGTVPLTVDASE